MKPSEAIRFQNAVHAFGARSDNTDLPPSQASDVRAVGTSAQRLMDKTLKTPVSGGLLTRDAPNDVATGRPRADNASRGHHKNRGMYTRIAANRQPRQHAGYRKRKLKVS
jgi:hypothetical protein